MAGVAVVHGGSTKGEKRQGRMRVVLIDSQQHGDQAAGPETLRG